MNESCHTYEWVMSHIWMSHVTHMNESCHTWEWVMSHIWVVVSHIWMSNLAHVNESRDTYEWVMSHIWMRNVTHMNETCHTLQHTATTQQRHSDFQRVALSYPFLLRMVACPLRSPVCCKQLGHMCVLQHVLQHVLQCASPCRNKNGYGRATRWKSLCRCWVVAVCCSVWHVHYYWKRRVESRW